MALNQATDEIRKAVFVKARSEFDHTNVSGLTGDPTFTQNPNRKTETPYVYMFSNGSLEIDVNKDEVAVEYTIEVECLVRYRSYRGGSRQAQQMADEVKRVVRGQVSSEYPDVSDAGYTIYKMTTGEQEDFRFKFRGANYYKVVFPIYVVAYYSGRAGDQQPVQAANYTFSGFEFTPSNRRVIEMWDSGNIVGASSYSNNNNGWNFDSVTYARTSTSEGTYTASTRTLAIDSDDSPIGLVATLNYELITDSTNTTTLTDTDNWSRIRSIRTGSVTPTTPRVQPSFTDDTAATFGLRNLSDWNTTNRSVDFRETDPHNKTYTLTAANAGDYFYIVTDSAHTLVNINESVFNSNVLNIFDRTDVGGYAIYVSQRPAVRDGESYTYTLTTS